MDNFSYIYPYPNKKELVMEVGRSTIEIKTVNPISFLQIISGITVLTSIAALLVIGVVGL